MRQGTCPKEPGDAEWPLPELRCPRGRLLEMTKEAERKLGLNSVADNRRVLDQARDAVNLAGGRRGKSGIDNTTIDRDTYRIGRSRPWAVVLSLEMLKL